MSIVESWNEPEPRATPPIGLKRAFRFGPSKGSQATTNAAAFGDDPMTPAMTTAMNPDLLSTLQTESGDGRRSRTRRRASNASTSDWLESAALICMNLPQDRSFGE